MNKARKWGIGPNIANNITSTVALTSNIRSVFAGTYELEIVNRAIEHLSWQVDNSQAWC